MTHVARTGLTDCYGASGRLLEPGHPRAAGQDAERARGVRWPVPRFESEAPGLVRDRLTDLLWSRDANPAGFPSTWGEAMQRIQEYNRDRYCGRDDWRMPNRRELRSLISHGAKRPALPLEHPFQNVFQGWYWSSTFAARAPAYAWYVHFAGGRMFYGAKSQDCLLWPVCGESSLLPRTGQQRCFDQKGRELSREDPEAALQDGALRMGTAWPEPRFLLLEGRSMVLDRLTNIVWNRNTSPDDLLTWEQALDAAARLADSSGLPWRLPNINELESLIDAEFHSPALSQGHPFLDTRQAYWSSTTSFFETDWSYCLYLDKGAVGVGYKPGPEFQAWFALDYTEDLRGV